MLMVWPQLYLKSQQKPLAVSGFVSHLILAKKESEKINENLRGCKNKEREVKILTVQMGISSGHLLCTFEALANMESTLSQSSDLKCNSIVLKTWNGLYEHPCASWIRFMVPSRLVLIWHWSASFEPRVSGETDLFEPFLTLPSEQWGQ